MDRVRGFDAIRAVCAVWVVMGHFGGPPIVAGIDETSQVGRVVNGLSNNLWNGPAAVIVFFVISGFCIHYPFAQTLRIPSVSGYASRRYLRVGVPLVTAMVCSPYLGVRLTLFHQTILWSLAAELVYYTIYPALLALRRRQIGWRVQFGLTFVIALGIAATRPEAKNYPSWGVGLNWVLGLPCWLLGCELAERVAGGGSRGVGSIWRWRLGVWGVSIVLSILRFHSPLGYPWTLNLFAILVAGWLGQEIVHFRGRPPAAWLEWVGLWSYSIYLVHVPIATAFARTPRPNLGFAMNWSVQMVVILGASYLFFLAVERPGHLLARWVGRRLNRLPVSLATQPPTPRPASGGRAR